MVETPTDTILDFADWPSRIPQSYGRAPQDEWERLVDAGYKLGLVQPCPDEEVLRGPSGARILNGAGAVPKEKNAASSSASSAFFARSTR